MQPLTDPNLSLIAMYALTALLSSIGGYVLGALKS